MNVLGGFPGKAKSGYNHSADHRQGKVVSDYGNGGNKDDHKGIDLRDLSDVGVRGSDDQICGRD